ncbi:hypothetical protein SAFG77S_00217 [Streptomyces afghaniensis]
MSGAQHLGVQAPQFLLLLDFRQFGRHGVAKRLKRGRSSAGAASTACRTLALASAPIMTKTSSRASKSLKNVRADTPAASLIASTVTCSAPCSAASRTAAATRAARVARFLRSRSPTPAGFPSVIVAWYAKMQALLQKVLPVGTDGRRSPDGYGRAGRERGALNEPEARPVPR